MTIYSQPLHSIRFLYDLKCPVRDGVKLSTDVYLRLGGGKWPVISQGVRIP